jgi:hypothetical protein
MVNRALDWMFRSRQTGRITVAQFPNVALWLFVAAVVAGRIVSGTTARTATGWIGAVGLGWWALDEVARGVNPWRRLLGVAGCAVVVGRVVSLGHL